MATKTALSRNRLASAPQAGLLVVNDHSWDVEASTNGDLIEIGELPANHKLLAEACAIYAQANDSGSLAAQTFDVYVETDDAEHTIFSGVAVAADTSARTVLTQALSLVAEKLGVSQVNRTIYLKLTAAPATSTGRLLARIASFPASA